MVERGSIQNNKALDAFFERRLAAEISHAAQVAFAFLANALGNPSLGHAIEANMGVALANYDG